MTVRLRYKPKCRILSGATHTLLIDRPAHLPCTALKYGKLIIINKLILTFNGLLTFKAVNKKKLSRKTELFIVDC